MGYLTWWNFPKKAWLIIIGELAIIVSLSVSLYTTYLSNVYFQAYVNSLSPILIPILSVAFGISSASIATYLYLGMKRLQPHSRPETHTKKRTTTQTPSTQPFQSTDPRAKVPDASRANSSQPKPLTPHPTRSRAPRPGSLKEPESPPVTRREKPDT